MLCCGLLWLYIDWNTSCEFIMNDCVTTTKQSTTKPCAYFLGYTVYGIPFCTRTYNLGHIHIIHSRPLGPVLSLNYIYHMLLLMISIIMQNVCHGQLLYTTMYHIYCLYATIHILKYIQKIIFLFTAQFKGYGYHVFHTSNRPTCGVYTRVGAHVKQCISYIFLFLYR